MSRRQSAAAARSISEKIQVHRGTQQLGWIRADIVCYESVQIRTRKRTSKSPNTVYFENSRMIKESKARREEKRHGKQICQLREKDRCVLWPLREKRQDYSSGSYSKTVGHTSVVPPGWRNDQTLATRQQRLKSPVDWDLSPNDERRKWNQPRPPGDNRRTSSSTWNIYHPVLYFSPQGYSYFWYSLTWQADEGCSFPFASFFVSFQIGGVFWLVFSCLLSASCFPSLK